MSSYTYATGLQAAAGPPSPHASFYNLPQLPNASSGGGVMYIGGSPAMTAGALPPQQVYVQQQPQQYIQQQPQPQHQHQHQHQHQQYIQQQPQPQTQLVHQPGQYGPYVQVQGGPSPLVPMISLSQQPSPQGVTYQQLPAQLAPFPQYAVHPLLGQPTKSSEIWEVFRPPAPFLNKMYSATNLPATQPYQPEMRLVSVDIPWTVSIKSANGQYVTVGEVYEAIFNTLQGVVTHPEYRLTEARTRKKMADQYQKRCTQYPLEHNEHTRGVKRVDYLLHRNVFGGLKRDDKQAEELMMLNDQKMQYTWVLSFIPR